MNNSNVWLNVVENSFENILAGVINFLPNLIIALLLILIGWLLGAILMKAIEQLFRILKVDAGLASAGVKDFVNRRGFGLNSGKFVGGLIKWFTIIVFLVAALEVLGLRQVNQFLEGVVIAYIPQVIGAVLILLIAALVGETLKRVVTGSAHAVHLESANMLGSLTKWAIWIFAALTALFELGIAPTFIQTLFTGAIVALALALGISFGLGGKEAAADAITKMRKEISHREK